MIFRGNLISSSWFAISREERETEKKGMKRRKKMKEKSREIVYGYEKECIDFNFQHSKKFVKTRQLPSK